MDKNELKQFSVALRLVEGKDLGAALDIILPYVESHPYVPYSEDVKDIKTGHVEAGEKLFETCGK